jgi:hypothetical protein
MYMDIIDSYQVFEDLVSRRQQQIWRQKSQELLQLPIDLLQGFGCLTTSVVTQATFAEQVSPLQALMQSWCLCFKLLDTTLTQEV